MSTSKIKKAKLRIKDHSVSKEDFDLIYDKDLDMYSTSPIPQDLDKYYVSENYISHTDSKKGLVEQLYQAVKVFMLKRKLNLISQFQCTGTLLDIGAGTGDFISEVKQVGWKVTGIEPSLIAREKAIEKGLSFFESVDELSNQKFDVITMWHVLEHVPDTKKQIHWLRENLNADGIAVIAVPNFNSYDANHYKEFWAAWDVPRHLHHFSVNSIKSLFSEAGFKLEKQEPLIFDSFYVSLLSEKYKNSAFQFLKAFRTGLASNLKAKRSGEYSSLIYVFKKENDLN